ncbi:hypothetical protein [Micromonospora endophytica]|uniref:Uncharacterized protein n=1 Tax=Micromonospora endophytica TaxID=515350 RepID=A0A2W2CLY2_9ACTN|nr:hypothetical protein [Micromonospora endophytica]PZF99542.1 hypothetical protein C1I93_05585 [Micromonospora endophytica]RIW46795.1 hypothetical protein D3H59_11000 [Micromonospora endophytica]BCJ59177.1 hypothetical protein Jiend_25990 [Micromonospora endophytica]
MKKVGIGIAVVLAVLCSGLGFSAYQLFATGKEMIKAGITRQQFDAQQVGAPETQVRAALPDPLTDLPDKDLYAGDPGKKGMPEGASCIYYSLALSEENGPDLWRFCFVNGTLAEKTSLTIPE